MDREPYIATPEVCAALDDVIEATEVEPDERAAFAEAGQRFVAVMERWTEEYDRRDWPALATITALEAECVTRAERDDDEWIDRAAAAKTVRAYLTQARAERAKLN